MDAWINETRAGGAQPSLTLNLFDWAAKVGANREHPRQLLGAEIRRAATGPTRGTPTWATASAPTAPTSPATIRTTPTSPNSPAFEQAWIQHLIDTFGNSQNGGVQYYTLGNEPGLWNHTHRDIHPNGVTHHRTARPRHRLRVDGQGARSRTRRSSASRSGAGRTTSQRARRGRRRTGAPTLQTGWPIPDVAARPDAPARHDDRRSDCSTTSRCTSTRRAAQFSDDVSTTCSSCGTARRASLWDPNYVDESWIASTGINGGRVNLINLMKNWVNTYYPGTKIGITEYNWGAEGHMNGATTQADIWGIFGREGLDLANRWTTPATELADLPGDEDVPQLRRATSRRSATRASPRRHRIPTRSPRSPPSARPTARSPSWSSTSIFRRRQPPRSPLPT